MSSKPTLITAATVMGLEDGSVLHVTPPYLITPSAAELAATRKIVIRIADSQASDESAEPTQATQAGAALPGVTLASRVESTLLNAGATPEEVRTLCNEAVALGCHGVCVNPLFVPVAADVLPTQGPAVITVCGFPLGASTRCTKAAEARTSIALGAHEIDMVLPVGLLKAGDYAAVRDDILAVRDELKAETLLKVIIEAPLLSDQEKVAASIICVEAGAHFVKTGTGHSGPATVEDVELIRSTVGDRARIKAAGGIRDRAAAEALLQAGADRIGTSSAAGILAS